MSPAIRSSSLPRESNDYRRSTPPTAASHGVQKHRKLSSTGGGRAWTEEEEAYLLRTRLHKMPYKHIAAHLRKTELACRLHYHQMSYGSNRRRRTDSVSSTVSTYTNMSGSQEPLDYKPAMRYSTPLSPPSPPESISPGTSVSNSPQQSRAHIPILPKPNSSGFHSMQPTPVELNKSLRLDTSFVHINQRVSRSFNHSDHIDTMRLQGIYTTYRDSFWSLIANEYSKDSGISAQKLEEAFFEYVLAAHRNRAASPPTPGPSPQDDRLVHQGAFSAPALTAVENGGFHAINGSMSSKPSETNSSMSGSSPVEKCAVASLLTVEKEVWAPREITTA
ncbi:hypothetical protein AJ80_08014 [Polytolypa hystricis UAMH7299]|uniref:Myb-like domain-containing protein n=1 Tax=Polytolypa hystricis (strain UAMH7299) TaxID=1447883 RepID=A0A2B7XF57_POLH7|nr:hypothetical protein AJ80_08014 [Polytolypa hystricis UAMH7299]